MFVCTRTYCPPVTRTMNIFSSRDQDLCNYTGLFGVMISSVCLIQHFFITNPAWITGIIAAIYLFSIVSFVLLAIQRSVAPVLLIVVSILVLMAELIVLGHGLFSVILLLLCIYSLVVTIYIYVDGVPSRLAHRAAAKRIEEQQWQGKI
jgi:hypothetical protein